MQKKFNIYEFLKTRALSFSALSSFADPTWGSPKKWYDTYILGIRQTSKELTKGAEIDKRFQDDPTFLPEIPRHQLQYKMSAILELGKHKIPLIGIPDNYDTHIIRDLKSGKRKWDSKRADQTDQLTFYALLNYLIHKVKPEDTAFYIDHVYTYERADLSIALVEPHKVETWKTKRTMADIIKLCTHIDKTLKKMNAYVIACNKSEE